MFDVIIPLGSSVLVALVPSIFSVFQKGKSLYNENLNELYKHFIAPIYYLLMSSDNPTYIIAKIENICETKPYLIPDTFLEKFSAFKTECKKTEVQNTEFYKQMVVLNKFLRFELHFSKSKLNRDEKRIAKNYFGKQPTVFGVFLISMSMGLASLIAAIPLYVLHQINIISDTGYYALVFIVFIIMCVLDFKAMNRYFDGKK